MTRRHVDGALIGLLGLAVAVSVLVSAIGVEKLGVVLVAIILTPAAATIASVLVGYRRYTQRRILPVIFVASFSIAVLISVAATHWPLRVSYACSRASFDAVAQRLRRGEVISTPLRAGVFTIDRAELSPHGIACLWTYPHPSGNTGFVQCRRDPVPFNLSSHVRLDDRWQFISED